MSQPIVPASGPAEFATNPTFDPGSNPWSGQPNKVDPGALSASGFVPQSKLAAEWMNYLLNNHGAWLDYIAYLIKVARIWPATPFGTNSLWSPVTHAGTGTGAVTPQNVGYTLSSGANYVVLITVGGAVGTAKFKLSSDGGVTYGAETLTAANVTVSGVPLSFSGTFVANDTYQFYPSLTPLWQYVDGGGLLRHMIDHNGLDTDRVCRVREEWLAGTFTGVPMWSYVVVGAGAAAFLSADQTHPCMALRLSPGGTFNDLARVMTSQQPFILAPNTVGVFQFEAWLNADNNKADYWIGISNGGPFSGSTGLFCVSKLAADTTWKLRYGDAFGQSTADTTVAPATAAGTRNLIRLELHGSATPLGAAFGAVNVGLVIVNNVVRNVIAGGSGATAVPATNSLNIVLQAGCSVAGNTGSLGLGPLLAVWTRLASQPGY